MTGQLACRAIPSPFQPNPLNNQLRIHSWVTHAQARQNASRRLVVDLNQGELDAAAVDSPARESISSHLVFCLSFAADTPLSGASTGRINPTSQLQNAKLSPR